MHSLFAQRKRQRLGPVSVKISEISDGEMLVQDGDFVGVAKTEEAPLVFPATAPCCCPKTDPKWRDIHQHASRVIESSPRAIMTYKGRDALRYEIESMSSSLAKYLLAGGCADSAVFVCEGKLYINVL